MMERYTAQCEVGREDIHTWRYAQEDVRSWGNKSKVWGWGIKYSEGMELR